MHYRAGGASTQSLVMRSKSGTVRMIDAWHRLAKLREYSAVDFGAAGGADEDPLVWGTAQI